MKAIQKNLGLALAISLTLVMTAGVTPIAAFSESPSIEDPNVTMPQSYVSDQLKGAALVKAPIDQDQLLVVVDNSEVVLNISEETLVIDSMTGLAASTNDLQINDAIYVYYSAAMTRSLPPQSHAIAIVTNLPNDKNHAELFTVGEITSKTDGEVRALNKESDLIVTFSNETPLTPFRTKQIAEINDIQVGTQLFIWYDIVAMSYPGQTGATKAVLVSQEEDLGVRAVYTPMAGTDAIAVAVQGTPIQLKEKNPQDQDGFLMLPLRAVAEELGFQVTWNGKDRSILLDNGTVNTTIYIGEDSYYKSSSQAIGLTQSFQLGAAPILIDGSTYVPAALFNLLYSDNDAVEILLK